MTVRTHRLIFALVLITAIFMLIAVGLSQGLMGDDTRVHVLGITMIFHKTGQTVFRLPSGRLLSCGWFESDDGTLQIACGVFVFALIGWQALKDSGEARERRKRGFPLD